MFSGLIAHHGRVAAIDADARGGVRLRIAAPDALREGIDPKDSIAVDGVCLTVAERDAANMEFDVVPETLARSTLGTLAVGNVVNLELSLRLGDRLGGHFVYGHVDATAQIVEKREEGQGHRVTVTTPPTLGVFIVEKGYVALDGVSLTVARAQSGRFEIALIPETSARTSLGRKGAGALLNLEIDPVARYALGASEAYVRGSAPTSDELAWAYEI